MSSPARPSLLARILLAAGMGILAESHPSAGQERLPAHIPRSVLLLDGARPFFAQDGFGAITSVWDATLAVPATPTVSVFARLGFTLVEFRDRRTSAVSRPRLGVILERWWGGLEAHVDLGAWGELDEATLVGAIADIERAERYGVTGWAAGASVAPEWSLPDESTLQARAGLNVLKAGEGGDDELMLVGALAWRPVFESVRLTIEPSVLWNVTSDDGLDESSVTSATLGAQLHRVAGAPELYVRVPLDDDLQDALDLVLGVRARVGG
ncbi:MAG TPA: hypothetical protein VFQ22_01925 [Longimicrobiales bacterium]|nr:hypothetical protein [Longimicrobiales bacterium]